MAACKTSVVTARAIAPVLERLESRRMLAGYDVFGTPGDDAIVITIGQNGEFTATVNGKRRTNTTDELLIHAGPGNDSIVVSRLEGIDMPVTIYGEAGNDSILGSIGNERIMCGDGDDTVLANNGNDTVYGEAGNDSLRGGAHADLLDGGDGYDTLRGDNGSDNLAGGDNPDRLRGSAGNDYITGGGGRDLIGGEAGDDTCHGDSGADIIDGGIGKDYVWGGRELDDIYIGEADNFQMDEAFNGECIDAAKTTGGSGGAKLDLTDNKLITNGVAGQWGLTGQLASGRGGNNAWDGTTGIVTGQGSTTINGGVLTSVGISTGSEVLTGRGRVTETVLWAGETVANSGTLVMYTYGGDANLDGKLNIEDYIAIDQGIAGNLTGWSNGDFNYDGKVNVDDYTTVIDSNIGNPGFVFPVGGTGVAAVGPISVIDTSKSDVILVYNDGSMIAVAVNHQITRYQPRALQINAGSGDDVISIELTGDFATLPVTITTGAGNDSIYSGGGNDRIDAGEGDDLVAAGNGKNTVYGGLGDDQLTGGNRIDLLDGGDGFDILRGLDGDDHLNAGEDID